MKTYLTALLLLLCTFTFAQNAELKKIEDALNKNLEGSYALRGLYDPPSYTFKNVSIADNGDVTMSFEDKSFTETYSFKDANIELDNMRVRIYQPSPTKKSLTLYSKNNEAIAKLLERLRELSK
ncbi:hypothetical protein [Chryseobacterium caseinilyticum]|uniref:DUF3471 domain-containing protein n=1 Tax=Chryseobacterium caseinilyticum TaxID=2771428 RepID=A0ABR8ZE55_9FLAO|nr:hypothetical protein [Chryseobacterium caseinilyticum]MBD8083567.1 hypothetical protein [Chryseobacterium caseinilyticum]